MRKILFPISTAIFIALLPAIVFCTTTHVSTESELQTAVQSATPGDTIYLNNGIYNDIFLEISKSGNADKLLCIMAVNGGEVKFRGKVAFKINASYVKLSGFDFDGASMHSTTDILFNVIGNYNVIEDMYINNFSNGGHRNHRYIMLGAQARYNFIKRCWFEKGTQHGIVIYGNYKGGEAGYFNTIQNCYFKAARQPDNGGSAIRLGTGGGLPFIDGSTTIKNNLFDHYDGENEIISLKSRNNIVDGNTFTNCHGQLTCRHYHNNIIQNNFFLTTESRPDGDCLAIWGEGHKVLNNYFANTKTRYTTGGAISFVSGTTEEEPTMKHEAVANILIKDNIIYEANSQNYAISFGDLYQKGSNNRTIMPKNITLSGNYIYNSSDKEQIYFEQACEGISYVDNKIFKNTGTDKDGISNTNPNLVPDKYGIYRADGKGPSGNPLIKSYVGPLWREGAIHKEIPATSISVSKSDLTVKVHQKDTLTAIIKPDSASLKVALWSSSALSVVTVNDGFIQGISEGHANIIVRAFGSAFTDTCKITVSGVLLIPVSEVTISSSAISLEVGNTHTLSARVIPDDAYNDTANWLSSDTLVASVNKYGIVTAKSIGMTTIYVTSIDQAITDSCLVSVINSEVYEHTETFEKMSKEGWGDPSTYIGNDGFSWTIVGKGSSGNIGNSKDTYFNNKNDQVGVYSGTLTNGISDFSVLCKDFVFPGNERTIQLLINDSLIASMNHTGSEVYIFKVNDINIKGDFTIALKNTSAGNDPNHIAIDDVSWNSYSTGTNTIELDEHNSSNPRIYPNPFQKTLTIQVFEARETQIDLIDFTGRVISSKTIKGDATLEYNPEYSELPPGVYLFRLTSNNGSKTYKIIRNIP